MADRSSRSSINLAVDTSQKVRPASTLTHAVPEFVGSMRGINPWAGDMSAAFNQFFGSINQSLNTVLETERAIEIDELKQTRIEVQKAAQAQALEDYEANRDQALNLKGYNPQLPATVQVGSQTISTDEWKSYGRSYSKSLGRLNGNRLYNNMIEEAAAQNITPEGFNAFSSQYFTDHYSGGTGDSYHDVEMQAAWRDKIQETRHQKEIAVVKRIQAKRMKAADDSVYSFADDNKFTAENYYASIGMLSAANPVLTQGEAASKVLGIWIEGAKKTKAGSQRLVQFLHRKDRDGEGVELQSLAERFPAEMALHEQNLMAAYKKFITLNGTKAATAVASASTVAISMPDTTPTQMKSKLSALTKTYQAALALDHKAGVPSASAADTKSKIVTEMTKIQTKFQSTVKVAQNADSGSGKTNHITKDELTVGSEALFAEMNFDSDEAAIRLGKTARTLMDKHNQGVHPIVIEKLAAALSSGDAEQAKRALKAVKIIDPTGSIIAKEFKDNPQATFLLSTQFANFDQVWGILHDENFKAAAAELTLAKVAYGDDPLPTGTDAKQDIAEQIEGVLFGTEGEGTLSVGEQILGNSAFVSLFGAGDDVRYSPTLRNAMKSQAILIAAQHKMQTGTNIGVEKLRERLAATFKGKVVPFDNEDGEPMLDFEREVGTDITKDESGQPINTSDVSTETARLGHSVMTPWGEPQNTYDNMNDAVDELIDNGLYGLQADGLDASTVQFRPHPGLRGTNTYAIMNMKTNMPLVLPIGRNIDGEHRYDAKGESKWWYPNETFKLTGDPAKDSLAVQPFIHPAITLIPVREGNQKDGKVMFYEMGIKPFFIDPPDDYLTPAKMKAAIQSKMNTKKASASPASVVASDPRATMANIRKRIQLQNRNIVKGNQALAEMEKKIKELEK